MVLSVYLRIALHVTRNAEDAKPLRFRHPFTVDFLKPGKFTDGPTNSERFNSLNLVNYLETHLLSPPRVCITIPIKRVEFSRRLDALVRAY